MYALLWLYVLHSRSVFNTIHYTFQCARTPNGCVSTAIHKCNLCIFYIIYINTILVYSHRLISIKIETSLFKFSLFEQTVEHETATSVKALAAPQSLVLGIIQFKFRKIYQNIERRNVAVAVAAKFPNPHYNLRRTQNDV